MSGGKYCYGCYQKLPCECRTDFYDNNGKIIGSHENKLRKELQKYKLAYEALKEANDFYEPYLHWDFYQRNEMGDVVNTCKFTSDRGKRAREAAKKAEEILK